jgi:hypothetical protein
MTSTLAEIDFSVKRPRRVGPCGWTQPGNRHKTGMAGLMWCAGISPLDTP